MALMVARYLTRLVHWAATALLALLVLVSAYAAIGMAGGSIPYNRGWREPETGIRIWIVSNGVHTALVLPKVSGDVDWRQSLHPDDVADYRYAAYDQIAFGWGERDFFLGTPRWSDLKATTLLHAAIGSDNSLMHVEYVPVPEKGPDVRTLLLTEVQYRRLAAFVRASFAPHGLVRHGYWLNDAFYEGTGHYSARTTCNAWTGAALRAAGVRVGAWTPFPITVLGWFGR